MEPLLPADSLVILGFLVSLVTADHLVIPGFLGTVELAAILGFLVSLATAESPVILGRAVIPGCRATPE
jgi:ABC-type enterochelin transport system permease subunit